MTLSELIEQLSAIQTELPAGVDPEVRIAHQPQWPFELHIAQVVEVDVPTTILDEENTTIIYLGEGGQIGYLPGIVKEELGW